MVDKLLLTQVYCTQKQSYWEE